MAEFHFREISGLYTFRIHPSDRNRIHRHKKTLHDKTIIFIVSLRIFKSKNIFSISRPRKGVNMGYHSVYIWPAGNNFIT